MMSAVLPGFLFVLATASILRILSPDWMGPGTVAFYSFTYTVITAVSIFHLIDGAGWSWAVTAVANAAAAYFAITRLIVTGSRRLQRRRTPSSQPGGAGEQG